MNCSPALTAYRAYRWDRVYRGLDQPSAYPVTTLPPDHKKESGGGVEARTRRNPWGESFWSSVADDAIKVCGSPEWFVHTVMAAAPPVLTSESAGALRPHIFQQDRHRIYYQAEVSRRRYYEDKFRFNFSRLSDEVMSYEHQSNRSRSDAVKYALLDSLNPYGPLFSYMVCRRRLSIDPTIGDLADRFRPEAMTEYWMYKPALDQVIFGATPNNWFDDSLRYYQQAVSSLDSSIPVSRSL